MDSQIKSYADFMPREETILVGDVPMKVREFSIAKRDAVVSIILSSSGIIDALVPILQLVKASGADSDSIAILGSLKDVALKVLGKQLSRVSCLTLDVPQNRKACGLDSAKLETDGEFGFEICPEMHAKIKGDLTMRQELELLQAILSVNDFASLIKKYVALVGQGLRTAGVIEKEGEKQTAN